MRIAASAPRTLLTIPAWVLSRAVLVPLQRQWVQRCYAAPRSLHPDKQCCSVESGQTLLGTNHPYIMVIQPKQVTLWLRLLFQHASAPASSCPSRNQGSCFA